MTELPVNSPEALERRIDDLLMVFVAVAKDRDTMTLFERARELNRLTDRIIRLDARLERARRAEATAGREAMSGFVDGSRVTPGTALCMCDRPQPRPDGKPRDCEFPCWQRIGLTSTPCCPDCATLPDPDTA